MAAGLTHKIGVVALGRAASTFSLLAVNAILARTWPKSELGLWSAVWTLGNTLGPIFLLGLPTSLLYFFPRLNPDARKGLLLQTLFCLSSSGLLLSVLLLIFGPGVAHWLRPETLAEWGDLGEYLLPFLPYLFSLVAAGFVDAALVAAEKTYWQAGLALGTGIGLVGAAWAGAALELEVRQLLWLCSGVGGLRLIVGLTLTVRAVGLAARREERWRGLGEYLSYSLPIWLSDAVGTLSRYIDRLLVVFFFSSATFAQYHLTAVEVPISLLLAAVATVLVPEVSRLYQEGRRAEIGALWQQAVGRLALVVFPLFFFLFAFAEPLVVLYLTDRYASACWIFRIFLLALPLRCAIYNPVLVGLGRARWALWGSLADLASNGILGIALVYLLSAHWPEWAFLGPAVAAVVATYLQVALLVGGIARHLGWRWRQLFPWTRLLRIGGFSAGGALVGLWLAGQVESVPASLALGGGGFALVLAILFWRSPSDRTEIGLIFRALLRS